MVLQDFWPLKCALILGYLESLTPILFIEALQHGIFLLKKIIKKQAARFLAFHKLLHGVFVPEAEARG